MFQKLLLTLALMLLLAPGYLSAQDKAADESSEAYTAEELAKLAKEPPLTQADIDAFIKLAAAPENDAQAAEKALANSGLSELRMTFVLTKVALGMMIAAGAPSEMILADQVPLVLQPTGPEIELIRKNLDKLAGS
ncbi:MAG: hypothetical protein LBP55_08095 [Candidatus Adiutrix sp.]|jgi:hypothetical protein|nr:hypothetical protein [Candidatus Adiutrix sp.]